MPNSLKTVFDEYIQDEKNIKYFANLVIYINQIKNIDIIENYLIDNLNNFIIIMKHIFNNKEQNSQITTSTDYILPIIKKKEFISSLQNYIKQINENNNFEYINDNNYIINNYYHLSFDNNYLSEQI